MNDVPEKSEEVIVPPEDEKMMQAVHLLAAGQLVAFPTETVYGLGADATNDKAIAHLYAVKRRPKFNPLIAHIRLAEHAQELVTVPPLAERLMKAYWPGPLTLVLPRRPDCPVSHLASAGLDTLAVRLPDNGVARELIEGLGQPIVAPSANRSGHVSPTRAQHVWGELDGDVAMILDGGPCRGGLESTVLEIDGERATVLRLGGLALEDIEAALDIEIGTETGDAPRPRSPGRTGRHYAPRLPLRLEATSVHSDEALLAFGTPLTGAGRVENLSESGNLEEAAANLFALLRRLDASDCRGIAVMPIPDKGLGRAINDRLRRATQPS